MFTDKKFTFIGAGNMAEAMIRGLITAERAEPDAITAVDISEARRIRMKDTYRVKTATESATAVKDADIIVIAVKPNVVMTVIEEIATSLTPEQLIISIAAGIPLEKIESKLPGNIPVIRAMPNTPALVQQGMTGIAGGAHATDADMYTAEEIFYSIGAVRVFNENMIDAVTAISGTGPAYVFYLMEAMIAAAIEQGMSPVSAHVLVEETIRGAGELMARTHEHPERLRQRVTTPGGTTQAAMDVLSANKVKEAFIKAIDAAAVRSRELAE